MLLWIAAGDPSISLMSSIVSRWTSEYFGLANFSGLGLGMIPPSISLPKSMPWRHTFGSGMLQSYGLSARLQQTATCRRRVSPQVVDHTGTAKRHVFCFSCSRKGGVTVLYYALVFLIVGLIACVLGSTGVAAIARP